MKPSQSIFRVLILLALIASFGEPHPVNAAEPKPPQEIFSPGPCTAGSNPRDLVTGGDLVYFTAYDNLHGTEIYQSNGANDGTWRVTELASGVESLKPDLRMVAQGKLYFTTNEPIDTTPAKQRLWITDGMPAADGATGAVKLLDFWPEASGYTISALAELNGIVYFIVKNPASNYLYESRSELWRTDGTDGGTWMIKAYTPYSHYYEIPGELVVYKGYLYFNGGNNYINELWRSDGTPNGTGPFGGLGSAYDFTPSGEFLYFFSGPSLYRTDGTASGTISVASLPSDAMKENLTDVSGTLYFTILKENQSELWLSNGTAAGTRLIKQLGNINGENMPEELTALGNTLFFTAGVNQNDRELWKTDGTLSGTVQVKDIRPDGYSSRPGNLTIFDGKVYFTTRNLSIDAMQFWRSDGTSAGTQMLHDSGIFPFDDIEVKIAATQKMLFLSSIAPCTGWELQTLSPGSSTLRLVTDINPSLITYGVRQTLTGMGGKGYFFANDYVHGYELWRSDGTLQGTRMVNDINPTGSSVAGPYADYPMIAAGPLLYFSIDKYPHVPDLWLTDGTAAGTHPVKHFDGSIVHSDLYGATEFQNQLFFFLKATTGYDLWKTDGTPNGTTKIANLPGRSFGTELNGKLYFLLAPSDYEQWLWVTDGTSAGTKRIKGLEWRPTVQSSRSGLLRIGERLYFLSYDSHGVQPWVTDGTEVGTHLLAEITVEQEISLAGSDDTLYIIDRGDLPGYRLWTTRGAPEGSLNLLRESNLLRLEHYKSIGGKLFFIEADTDVYNYQLWVSDGTQAGTQTLLPSGTSIGGYPYLFAAKPYVFFTGEDEAGAELWQSDGTPEGTNRVADLWPGPQSSQPWIMGFDGTHLYFEALVGSNPNQQEYFNVFYGYDTRTNHLFLPITMR